MPRLVVLGGPLAGRVFELAAGDVLGRGHECAASLPHPSVSRRHARLEREGGAWKVVDLASRNGVRLNGRRIDGRATLARGDLLVLGRMRLRVAELEPGGAGGEALVLEEEIELVRPGRASGATVPAPGPTDRERRRARLLEEEASLVGSDLGQLPPALRWTLYLLAGLVAGTAFVLALKAVVWLRAS